MDVTEKIFCCYCGELIKYKSQITKEHLVPLSKGGNNSSWNIRLCCKPCNTSRGNKSLIYWKSEIIEKINHLKKYSPGLVYRLEAIVENIDYWQHYIDTSNGKLVYHKKGDTPRNFYHQYFSLTS